MEKAKKSYPVALAFLTLLFFAWGFITVLNDILVPHFKNLFDLSYVEASLLQSVFFAAYFVMSWPASFMVRKVGYRKGIVFGLLTMALGAFLFYPASIAFSYGFFLTALFILASGMTVLQVAANPYVTELGSPEMASSRLNLTQGINSLGTTLAGFVGAALIFGTFTFFPFYDYGSTELNAVSNDQKVAWLADFSSSREAPADLEVAQGRSETPWIIGTDSVWQRSAKDSTWGGFELTGERVSDVRGVLIEEISETETSVATLVDESGLQTFRQHEAETVQMPYVAIGIALIVFALIFMRAKLPTIINKDDDDSTEGGTRGSIWRYPHLLAGAGAIFFYVGAEVAIGSYLVLFFELSEIAGMPEKEGGFYVSVYWGAAMVGRFLGAAIQSVIKPNRVLAVSAAGAGILVALTVVLSGPVAMGTIIAVGLFNSIMFPTIFSLSVDGLGKLKSLGSGLLISMILGGAIVPLLVGALADKIGIQTALSITIICYAYILFFAVRGYRLKKDVPM